MNANEIADGLAQMHIEKDVNGLFNKRIQNMLRQFGLAESIIKQQQLEIEALKAGKIRAYDNGVEDGRKPNTNLVKDLEDIDINITWNENSMRDFGKDELNFARAILRKAQEK